MGWSCSQRANWVFEAWEAFCRLQTDSQNVFASKGEKFFYERSNIEHGDGAITGTVYKFVGENSSRKSVSFRIEANGMVTRAPKVLKDVSPSQEHLNKKERDLVLRLHGRDGV